MSTYAWAIEPATDAAGIQSPPPQPTSDHDCAGFTPAHSEVSQSRHNHCAVCGVDYRREQEIRAAGMEIRLHMQLTADALSRYRDTSCLLDQADADRHQVLARQALIRMQALIAGREQQA